MVMKIYSCNTQLNLFLMFNGNVQVIMDQDCNMNKQSLQGHPTWHLFID